MSKIFQIFNNKAHWLTPYTTIAETVGIYAPNIIFAEAPDDVQQGWTYTDGIFSPPEPRNEYEYYDPEVNNLVDRRSRYAIIEDNVCIDTVLLMPEDNIDNLILIPEPHYIGSLYMDGEWQFPKEEEEAEEMDGFLIGLMEGLANG